MSKREPLLYFKDVLQAIKRIESYTKVLDFVKFDGDIKTIDAVVRNLEIIGEAAKNLSIMFKNKYPQMPWEQMIGMRNKVVHEYFGVDNEILWQTIKDDLPAVKKQVTDALKMIKE